MPVDTVDDLVSRPAGSEIPAGPAGPVSLLTLGAVLFRIGATTFGGMWAGMQKLEAELVERRGWMTIEEQQALMVAATLIPAPKFLAFGGLIGFRLRGWMGGIVALFALLAPGAIFVLLGAILLSPEVVGAPMVPLRRAVGIAIVGLLFGNAYHQLRRAKVKGSQRMIGIGIAASVAVAAVAGVPLLAAAGIGFAAGALLIRGEAK